MQDGKGTISGTELLAAEDVAGLVGVKKTTVYKWCKEGRLPCLKVGKYWRVRRGALEDFLDRSEHPATLARQLDSFLRVPDNVLAIAQNVGLLHCLDAAFFRVGESRGGLLAKFYSGEETSEGNLIADFERNGLEAGRLRREGRLFLRPEEQPQDGSQEGGTRVDQLGGLLEEGGEERSVWASFDWVRPTDLDTVLKQQQRLSDLLDTRHLVIKTAAIEDAIDHWPGASLRRAQSTHSVIILASEEELSMSRATPMPPS
jgi:excisionase family DNA binding protein